MNTSSLSYNNSLSTLLKKLIMSLSY